MRKCVLILVLILASLLAYGQTINFHFLGWDDDVNVYNNSYYQPVTLPNTLQFWHQRYNDTYRPVPHTVWAALAANAQLPEPRSIPASQPSSLDPRVFHAANLALHILNGLLVYAILCALIKKDWAAALGAGLFALHPVQVEAVAWITGINDLLHAFFSLGALWLYLRYALLAQGRTSVERDTPHALYALYGAALVCFVLALLSKPAAVTVPLVAAILGWHGANRPLKSCFKDLISWGIAALICVWAAQSEAPPDPTVAVPWWTRPLVAGDALGFYLGKLVWPFSLAPDYGRPPRSVVENLGVVWLLPLLVGVVLWRYRRRVPGLTVGALLFVVALLPVLGLLTFRFQFYSTVADRYLYFPMLGICFGLAWWLAQLQTKASKKAALAATSLVLLAFGLGSWSQARHWNDTWALWRHTLRVNTQSWLAHDNLGMAFLHGDQLPRSVSHFEASVKLNPNYHNSRLNLGSAYDRQGRFDDALQQYWRASSLDATDPRPLFNMGVTLSKRGQTSQAIARFRQALSLDPALPDAHYALGLSLNQLGDYAEAEKHFALSVQLDATQPEPAMQWGLALAQQGRLEEAIARYRQAIAIAPGYSKAHYNLAVALARQGDAAGAITHWSEAVKLKPDFAEAHANLGLMLEKQGQTAQAIEHYRQALQINPQLAPVRQALARLGAL